jgi:CTP synthase
VIEFARNVLGIADALRAPSSTARRPPYPVISELPEQKRIEGLGGTMRLGRAGRADHARHAGAFLLRRKPDDPRALPPSLRGRPVSSSSARGRGHDLLRASPDAPDHADPGVAADRRRRATKRCAGKPDASRIFIGAQFHPELTSRPLRPQPMFMGLVAAAIVRKFGFEAAGDPAIGRWVRSKLPERQPVA